MFLFLRVVDPFVKMGWKNSASSPDLRMVCDPVGRLERRFMTHHYCHHEDMEAADMQLERDPGAPGIQSDQRFQVRRIKASGKLTVCKLKKSSYLVGKSTIDRPFSIDQRRLGAYFGQCQHHLSTRLRLSDATSANFEI